MVNINTGLNAQQRGWGSGWPHCSVHPVPLIVSGASFPAGVAREVHDLAEMLLIESEQRHLVNLHSGWCWGYGCRPITGTTNIPSNHSWGLALDVNAPENSYGSNNQQLAPMANLWAAYGWRWGGRYSGTKDPMHFEFMGTPGDAKDMTDKAHRELGQGGDDMTDHEKAMLDKAWAFVQEVEKVLGPGKQDAPAGAAGHRVGLATREVEKKP